MSPAAPARLDPHHHAEALHGEAELFRAAVSAAAPGAPVPTCPGWTTDDLVAHVTAVYGHKVVALRTGAQPAPGSWATQPPAGTAPLAWYDAVLGDLLGELTARDPADATWTWWPPEQTVAFWWRRMAQETAVHRVDAQCVLGSAEPIGAPLGADGIDELLGWLSMAEMPGPVAATAAPAIVVVRAGEHAWTVRLSGEGAETAHGADGSAGAVDATVSGAPGDLLLHLWGRTGASPQVATSGDPAALDLLHAYLTDLR